MDAGKRKFLSRHGCRSLQRVLQQKMCPTGIFEISLELHSTAETSGQSESVRIFQISTNW